MNHRRELSQKNTSLFTIVSLVACVVIASAGWVRYADLTNRRVTLNRQIDKIEQEIEHAKFNIRSTEMRIDQQLNRFVIRQQLEQNKSSLKPISIAVIEEINPSLEMQRNMAVALDEK